MRQTGYSLVTMARRSPATEVSAPVPAIFNKRQLMIKKILISTAGLISDEEIAAQIGYSAHTVWKDRRYIRAMEGPRSLEGWNEDDAIHRTLNFYYDGLDLLAIQLERVFEYEKKKQEELDTLTVDGKRSRILNPYNSGVLAIGIFNAMATFRKDLNSFLLDTGLVRRAPLRIDANVTDSYKDMSHTEVEKLLAETKKELTNLRKLMSQAKQKPRGKAKKPK